MKPAKRSPLFALLLMLAGLLALWLMPSASPAAAADARWRARYFNNRNLSGDPVLRRDEDAINHDWGGGSPSPGVVNDDNFSARWIRSVGFAAGTYRFSATIDDGVRVWIDDQLIIDSWVDSQVRTLTADRALSAGDHTIRVEYYEAGGVAVAKFSWQQIGGGSPPPPTGSAWRGEYFANINLTGAPAVVRDDANVDFNWGTGSPAPGIPSDRFSARWTRTLNFAPGTYRFDVFSDDGVRLWVNNVLVIDQWRDQSDGRFSANVSLNGATALRLEYYENTGRAAISLSWSPPGGSPQPGPTPTIGVWRGEYFNNRNLTGAPSVVRNDAVIDFNWGNGSPAPGMNSDQFSVRWTRTINFPAGSYRFDVFSDDGIRLWANNQLIIDQWRDQTDGRFSAIVNLSGDTPLRVEYYENTGRAAVAVSWNPPVTGGPTTPPAGSPTATVTGTGGARLNIRSTPGGTIIGQLAPNQTVGLTGFQSADRGWLEIFRPGGGTGWVSARYVTTSVPTINFPVK